MEPPVVSYRRFSGPIVTLFKKVAVKCIRWYVRPQTAALEAELAQVREELTQLTKLHVRTQALFLKQYQEVFRRLEQMEACLPAAAPTGKAA